MSKSELSDLSRILTDDKDSIVNKIKKQKQTHYLCRQLQMN